MTHVSVLVYGDRACFTRPEMSVERLTYECMTPTAAKGLLQAIYIKPDEFEWEPRSIVVHNPIRTELIKINEVKDIVNRHKPYTFSKTHSRTQRISVYLTNVCYSIYANIYLKGEPTDINNIPKHIKIFNKRIHKGQCFRQPFLGIKGFPAFFRPVEELRPIGVSANLGMMPLAIKYGSADFSTKVFLFPAKLEEGVLKIPSFYGQGNEV